MWRPRNVASAQKYSPAVEFDRAEGCFEMLPGWRCCLPSAEHASGSALARFDQSSRAAQKADGFERAVDFFERLLSEVRNA